MAERFVQSHIRNLPLFEHLTPPQIGVVASVVAVLRFEPGQLIFQEGQPNQGLFLFVSGRGLLTRRTPNGMEETIGAVAGGQFVDEDALYNSGVETASLHVVESAIVLLIPRAPFVQLLTIYPEIRANVRVQTTANAQARETAVKLFKGQRTDETVLQVWRRHWWAVAQHSWIALVVAIVMFIIALLIAERAPVLALGAAGLAVVIPGIIIAYLYYDWQDDSVVLSDQRIVRIWHHLITFETTISEMPLDQVLEVNTNIPPGDPFARLFQYGNITVKTAGEGVNMFLDMMPHPMVVQSMIFTQRDRFKERIEQRQRNAVRSDIQEALGMSPAEQPAPQPVHKSDREASIGLPFVRTKFLASNGDLVYRKHSSVWMQHVFLPGLFVFASLVFIVLSLVIPNFPLSGGVGLAVGMFALIVSVIWLYAADWDWRSDMFIIGSETITLIRQRPFWLQNQVERIRIAQIDNVKSEVIGLINNLINRGNVRISLIGTDLKDAKVMDSIFDPQEVQAEISRRQAAIKAERQTGDIEQQRQVIKEYLQTYHEIQQTQEAPRAAPQQPQAPVYPAVAPQTQAQPPVYPAAPQNGSNDAPPLPPRDGIRPPRVPRARPE